MRGKLLLGILLLSIAVVGYTVVTYADEVQDAQSTKTNLQEKKEELQKDIEELEKDKGDIVRYIEKLDTQLNSLQLQKDKLEAKIVKTDKKLKKAKIQLEEAQATESMQYDTMKKRIKYMYENGSSDYVDIILNAKNMSDLLNRSEYMEKISAYDKGLLTRYQETRITVTQREQQAKDKLEELNNLNEELALEQGAVTKLIDNKTNQITKFENKIDQSETEIDKFDKAIASQEKHIEDLLEAERKKIEEAERKKAAEEAAAAAEAAAKAAELAKQNNTTVPTATPDVSPVKTNSSGFCWPLKIKGVITSVFGNRTSPTAGASTYHKGIDIGIPTGTAIVAVQAGTVVTSSYQAAAGNYLMIYHGNSVYSVYMHCSKLNVAVGDVVTQGEVVALVGSTGVSTGPHLHFGVSVNGTYVNPMNYVSY